MMRVRNPSVFISYSHGDGAFAQRLRQSLHAQGVDLWIDVDELLPGDSLLDKIHAGISTATFFFVILSRASVTSRWVQHELKTAKTLELRGEGTRIVPIIAESCDVPPYLVDKAYLDLSNTERFDDGITRLSRLIDEELGRQSVPNYEPMSSVSPTVDQLGAKTEFSSDEWFEAFKQLPLVQDCRTAILNQAFGGHFHRSIQVGVSFASNQGGAIEQNNLIALLGFLKDAAPFVPNRQDVRKLLRDLVEDASIGTTFRWFLFSALIKAVPGIGTRAERLEAMPRVFAAESRDPLADRIVMDFFTNEGNLLGDVWRAAPVPYREEVWQYIQKVSSWSRSVRLSESDFLSSDCPGVLRIAIQAWQGLTTGIELDVPLGTRASQLLSAQSSESVVSIVEHIETLLSDSTLERLDEVTAAIDREFCTALLNSRGRQIVYDLLVRLIKSPNVDVIASTLWLMLLVEMLGVDSVRFDDSFPSCLLRKKEHGHLKNRSILQLLVEAVAVDPDDLFAVHILAEVTRLFPLGPFLAAVSIEIKDRPEEPPFLQLLLKAIHGEIPRRKVDKFVTNLARSYKSSRPSGSKPASGSRAGPC